MIKENTYIVRVYGDVEPKIAHGPFNKRHIYTEMVKYFRDEPYSDEDGIYMLTLTDKGPEMKPFSDGFVEECNNQAMYSEYHYSILGCSALT